MHVKPKFKSNVNESPLLMIPYNEVQLHNKPDDCWVIIHENVYNLTPFLAEHPGGAKVILKQAGQDGTVAFDQIHPKDIIDRFLPKELLLGVVDPKTLPKQAKQSTRNLDNIPPLSTMLNLFDFEKIAEQVLSKEAWAYYSSAGDDELTFRDNHEAFQRILLKPKVLVNVKHVDPSTTLFGHKSALPFYISATALGKLGHPEGEVVLTRAAGTRGIIQMMPTLASCSVDEMTSAKVPGQIQWFQLYVNEDRKLTASLIQKAERLGAKVLCITVDAPQLGRREKDMRVKFVDDAPDEFHSNQMNRNQGAGRAISSFIDASLCWDDLPWFKSVTKMPIVLKGIQSGEDAIRAALSGVDGIIVSNHGGRQLDTVKSGIEMLREVMKALKSQGLQDKLTVMMDGGIRRATDIYKALALGAKAVGIGDFY